MRTRSIEILPDHFYHVYNRGNNKQRIFRTEENFRFFLRKFHEYFSEARVQLFAYCLMPNHFHLLIRILQEFNFPNLMRSFSTSYVKSFHSWYETSGHLFEDDYQAKPLDDENHLVQAVPYVHLNPTLAGLVKNPEDWEFSNCRAWCSDEDRESFPFNDIRKQLYGSPKDYREYLKQYATRKREIQEIERMLLRR